MPQKGCVDVAVSCSVLQCVAVRCSVPESIDASRTMSVALAFNISQKSTTRSFCTSNLALS